MDHRNNSITSKRLKLISFSYTPVSINELIRAQSGFQKNEIFNILFKGSHLTLDLYQSDLDSTFNELIIAKRLHTGTAAHKPTHYQFGDANGKELSVEEFDKKDDSDEEFDD